MRKEVMSLLGMLEVAGVCLKRRAVMSTIPLAYASKAVNEFLYHFFIPLQNHTPAGYKPSALVTSAHGIAINSHKRRDYIICAYRNCVKSN